MTDGRLNRPANDFFSFCLVKESADEVTTIFNSLSIDGKVIDPLAPVFGPRSMAWLKINTVSHG
ncbi:MAG: hypothetical protein ACLSID_00905 [Lactococcus lactis]